jgi:predicted Holliday junction resolvase-like endonuclease
MNPEMMPAPTQKTGTGQIFMVTWQLLLTGIAALIMFILLVQYQDITTLRASMSAHEQLASQTYVRRDDYTNDVRDIRNRAVRLEEKVDKILEILYESTKQKRQ